jgi:hypothetical protein
MSYPADLRDALYAEFGKRNVVLMPKWSEVRNGTEWRGKSGKPLALVLHHSAGAATSSSNPKHAGNQRGANKGVINFIQSHYRVPAANFSLDRDGCLYLHNAWPVWHAGLGSFRGKKPWSALGIPDNLGNNYMLGVEIIDKGLAKTFTQAQKDGVAALLRACADASDWDKPRGPKSLIRRPQHRDWAGNRKVDLRYSNADVASWL